MDVNTKRKNVLTASGVNIVVGTWLIASPFALNFADSADALWNHVIVGLIVLVLAAARVNQWAANSWMSWLNVGLGLWLIIAPFVIDYGETVLWNSIISGVVVAAMGAWSASIAQSAGGPRTQARA